MNGLVIFVMFVMLSTSCRSEEEENVASTKFVPMTQQKAYGIIAPNFLIEKVHNPKIKIVYGFSDNDYCDKQFSNRDEQLKKSISKALRVWLASLADKDGIVDKFEYRYRETHKDGEHRKFKYKLRMFGKPDLSIIFYCGLGRSFARIRTHTMIHMFQYKGVELGVSDLKKYSLTTLIHELGHAFGLDDTYITRSEMSSQKGRYNVSDGGDANTVGKQPISVMNQHYLVALDSAGELQLGEDDTAGMNWLYSYHVAKNIDSSDCPAGYLYEDSTKGCAPRYPLIFAVRQNDFSIVDRLLSDDPTIDIDQQDELGNSALHYAANAQNLHGSELYDYLINKGADSQLKNNKGEIAQDLLSEEKRRKDISDTLLQLLMRQVSSSAVLRQVSYTLQQENGAEIAEKVFYLVDINRRSPDSSGKTLLHLAIIEKRLDIVKILLALDHLDVNIQSKLSEETALHYAARFGQVEIAKLLLEHRRINTELKDTWGKSPLARALSEGQVEVWRAIRDSLND